MAMFALGSTSEAQENLMRLKPKKRFTICQSKFTPDIAVIWDVSGSARDISGQKYYSLTIPGFSFPFSESAEFIRI